MLTGVPNVSIVLLVALLGCAAVERHNQPPAALAGDVGLAKLAQKVSPALAGLISRPAPRPGSFRIERAALIDASTNEIFPPVIPALKKTYCGAACGKGNAKAGKGHMKVADSASPFQIAIKLDAELHLAAQSSGASIEFAWSLYGPQLYLAKLLTLFFNRGRLIGKDFAMGLANLQVIVETNQPGSPLCN